MTITLVLGGARSGKSSHAEALAKQSGLEVIYLATAHAGDGEMATRIEHHRRRRPAGWTTVEEKISLGAAILSLRRPGRLLLVDCLTVWLSNLLFAEEKVFPEIGVIHPPAVFESERAQFLRALQQGQGDIVLVSNEVGLGVVPQGAVSRWFVDEAGRLNQAVAAQADKVVFVAAGLPLTMKG